MRFATLLFALVFTASSACADTMRVAVISDLNSSYGSTSYGPVVHRAIEQIIELSPDLVISTGDMVAGQRRNPRLTGEEVEAMWQAFHATVTLPLQKAGIPLLVTPGNHDASGFSGFEVERKAYDKTWTDHAPDLPILDGERYPFRYAVSFKGVLFIGLDATMAGGLPVEEREWLEQLLVEERTRHQSVIVFSHLPMWPVAQGRENDVMADADLHALLKSAGVGAVLSGHHHAYYPGVSDGVLYLAQACLGGGPRILIGTDVVSHKGFSIIEIEQDGTITEQAYSGLEFETPIPLTELPASIGEGKYLLVRRDLSQ